MKFQKILTLLVFVLLSQSTFSAADVTILFRGNKVSVKNHRRDSVSVAADGTRVTVNSLFLTHRLRLVVRGKSADGQLVLRTAGKAQVRLEGLDLTSQDGAPLWLKSKKRVEIVAAKGTENTLCIAACRDTATQKAAAIWSKDKIRLSGSGILRILAQGDGCKGIRTKDDIDIEHLNLQVITTGNNLGEATPSGPMGGPPPFNGNEGTGPGFPPQGPPPAGSPPPGPPPGRPDSLNFPPPAGGPGFPPPGGGPGRPDSLSFPPMGGGQGFPPLGGGAGPVRHKYLNTTKGIKSLGRIVVSSGTVDVQTNSPGAEGIEGKQGVELNGGIVTVLAVDDAINANAPIRFGGAHVTARSTTNDAVDANDYSRPFPPFGQQQGQTATAPMIVITGGTVYAWSQIGPPEEGLDCDSSPIAVEGGILFSTGSGMGDMPSVPTSATALQPTVLLLGLPIAEGQPVSLSDSQNQPVLQLSLPFSLQRSSSLLSHPQLRVGESYTLRTANFERTFTLTDSFTIVR